MANTTVGTKIVTLRVTPEFDRVLRIEAAKADVDKSTFIRQALKEKLERSMGLVNDGKRQLSAVAHRVEGAYNVKA